MIEIRLPEISENVDSGDVVKLLVSPGDVVTVDQPLIELETEKAVFEVPSTAAGTVKELTVAVGDTVKVGAVIARIETGAAAATAPAEKPQREPERESSDETPTESGSTAPTPVVSAETAPVKPAVSPEPTPEQVLAAVAAVAPEASLPEASLPVVSPGSPAPASPTVRRLARELGIDIHDVPGSGPATRISSEDVHRYAKSLIAAARSASAGGAASGTAVAAAGAARPLPDFARFGEIERVPMTKIRQVTAANMANAWNTVAAVTQNDEADVTELEAARKRYANLATQAGGKLTMTAILLKVCAGAIKRFPEFNASIDVARHEIIYKKYVNIGIAVDTERGLLVPVVRNVDRKNIVALSVELSQLAEKARNKKITPADMEGGNFTISNLGGIGGTSFSPIVNTPEVAVIGVSRAKMRPVWR
ncbi:MAG: 2-oxo acid dehydrogenase subunit E2, partial [Candidatus Krumholzibacteriota bacterium]|nr:2-oxo acid dehydrogenase subunit E2 [Candidatus Krumholzibacteriota bacterium]